LKRVFFSISYALVYTEVKENNLLKNLPYIPLTTLSKKRHRSGRYTEKEV